MSIVKPCPACEGDESHLGWAFDGSEQQRVCCSCDMAGPSASCAADADAAWNALPRRGDGLAWQSEPPDRPGWWWCDAAGAPARAVRVDYLDPYRSFPGARWAGPIPEPPAPDAGEEAAK